MKRVILIEDNVQFTDATVGNLHDLAPDWRIETARTMNEGLALAVLDTDLILLDAMLPDSDVATTISWIPTLAKHSPVVILTAKHIRDTDAFMRCIENGAYEVVEKTALHNGGLMWLIHLCNTAMAKFTR